MVISNTLQVVYEEAKYWTFFAGIIWGIYKGLDWLKRLKTNDLHHIQLGVNDMKSELQTQTTAIVNELKELRSDFKTYYAPQYVIAASPARARAKATKNKK